jgi:hypothetical protein
VSRIQQDSKMRACRRKAKCSSVLPLLPPCVSLHVGRAPTVGDGPLCGGSALPAPIPHDDSGQQPTFYGTVSLRLLRLPCHKLALQCKHVVYLELWSAYPKALYLPASCFYFDRISACLYPVMCEFVFAFVWLSGTMSFLKVMTEVRRC